MNSDKYLEINKASWNKRTGHHLESDFYDMDSFYQGKSSLNDIELGLLGNIEGKSVLHLQCHFGQDTISFARMGANATGIDLSDEAIKQARKINEKLNLNAQFIESDVYDLPNHLDEQFDIVFTSYGTIGWLPDLDKWASVVSHFLKPGGKFVFVEFHPNVWMYDDDFTHVKYNYFKDEPIVESVEGTYAQNEKEETFDSVSWNHGLSEVMTSLLNQNLTIKHFKEYNYSPYNCFDHTEKLADKKYILKPFGQKMPLCYSLVCEK